MDIKTFTWTETHSIYEVGDRVTPTSNRHELEMGKTYTVTECIEPCYAGDVVTVFVEGQETGVGGEYLTLVD